MLLIEKPLDIDAMKFTVHLDRGGLKYPQKLVVDLVLLNSAVISKLTSEQYINFFLNETNQRNVALNVTKNVLVSNEFNFWNDCQNNHKAQTLVDMILYTSTNCLLNNFCKNKNNAVKSSLSARKMSTIK